MTRGLSVWRESKEREQLAAEERQRAHALTAAERQKRERLAAELQAAIDAPLIERPVRG